MGFGSAKAQAQVKNDIRQQTHKGLFRIDLTGIMKKYLYVSLAVLNLGVIFYFWLAGSARLLTSGGAGLYLALGRLSGLLAVFFVLLQFITAGRARWLEEIFGLDRLTRFHHWVGTFLLGFILAHPLFLIFAYKGNTGFFAQLWDFINNYEDVLGAAIAVLLFTVVAVYSIIIAVKKINFEWWYLTHLLVYLAIALAFGHQLQLGGDFLANPLFVNYWYLLYTFVFGNLLYFRLLVPLWNFNKHRFVIDRVVTENLLVTSVYIQGQNLQNFKIKAGQFMIFRFLDKAHWWQAHPFSLSIAPNNEFIRVSIKNVGDFTATVNSLKPKTKVFIEGPYGVFTADRAKSQKILFLAGGIGITPIRSLIEELGKQGKNMILLYGNKTFAETSFKSELDRLATRCQLLTSHYIMSNDPSWPGEQGKIDENLLKKLVPDLPSREVFLCGSPPMMEAIKTALINLGVNSKSIYYEKFSL